MVQGRTDPIKTAYWRNVRRAPHEECWTWTGCKGPQGYGQLRHETRLYQATHLALEFDGRPRPGSLFALHSCDNRACVNPKHLRWGDHKDNYADAVERNPTLHHKPNHCRKGHELTGDNLYTKPDGRRECKTCMRAQPSRHAKL